MLLMEEAERIAREEHGSVKIAVISGIFLVCFRGVIRALCWEMHALSVILYHHINARSLGYTVPSYKCTLSRLYCTII